MRTTIQDGAALLLGETVKILNEKDVDYIIVGGWSPYLLNSTDIKHPGTKDVDILFRAGTEEAKLGWLIKEFLSGGFTQSAKHSFQLLKTIPIKGIDFVFNVDMLHPGDNVEKPEMFIEHVDFPVKESHTMRANYKSKTIVLPKSDFFFKGFFTQHEYEFESEDGHKESVTIKLLDEAGLILSKAASAFNVKRTRDAFDIFLALKQSRDYDSTLKKLVDIAKKQSSIRDVINNMNTEKNLNTIDFNTSKHAEEVGVSLIHSEVTDVFSKFFNDFNDSLHK